MSKSLHDDINYFDSSSLHSSNSSGHNILTLRPKPPPYDEYRAKKYGITRSQSTYSACNPSSLCQDTRSDKVHPVDSQEDAISQYSDGDPPRLTDHLSKLSISRHCIRPVTLRPPSPTSKQKYRPALSLSKAPIDQQQSPSGDSGVRMTPNEIEQSIRSRELEVLNYLHSSSSVDNDHSDELKILRIVNNKLSLSELNNQNLISKATHLIGKLRQRLKDKDQEISILQKKLKDNNEKLLSKEKICNDLETLFKQSCQQINDHKAATSHIADTSTQTVFPSDQNISHMDLQDLSRKFEEERSKWLEEKALVVSYHKQLNEKYQHLLLRNSQLENELQKLQGHYISDGEYSSDTYVDSESVEHRDQVCPDPYSVSQNSNNSNQSISRLVKFEESLC